MTDHSNFKSYDFYEYLYFTHSGVKSNTKAFVYVCSARTHIVLPVPIAP